MRTAMPREPLRPVLTIGHSNLPLDRFLRRLEELGVDMVVDLRAHPHTQLQPWFRKRSLKMSLIRHGIVYCYLGRALGNRPPADSYRGRDGAVDFRRWEASVEFQEGIDWVLEEAARHVLCLMGGPGRPEDCPRHHLVAQALLARGCDVRHVLPDGSVVEARPDLYHYQAACEARARSASQGEPPGVPSPEEGDEAPCEGGDSRGNVGLGVERGGDRR